MSPSDESQQTYPEAQRDPSVLITSREELFDIVGRDLKPSEWHAVNQSRIDAFASVSGDFQWIHVDPERAATGPFGHTIAHGYLTLALAPMLLAESMDFDRAVANTVNYGIDRARFPAPLTAGNEIRVRGRVAAAEETVAGIRVIINLTVEARGIDKPVLVAELVWVVQFSEKEPN